MNTTEIMSLPVKIGNYRFERNLGNGTFGKVKRKSTALFHQLTLLLSFQASQFQITAASTFFVVLITMNVV